MNKLLRLLAIPALVAVGFSAHGAEQRTCIDRSRLVDALVEDYGEQLAEVREVKGQGLLEFHVSPTEGTWTALLTDDDGISCVLATGEGLDPAKNPILKAGTEV
ncbi:MAG TPA: hypothetical protein VGC25_07085 [Alphaproteobacteria bacterium]|jgi:hypothetical protein